MTHSTPVGSRLAPSAVTPRWLFIAGVLSVTVVGAVVRWGFLDHPMRYDEAYNYLEFSSQSPWHIATHYKPNNHLLHTLFVRVATFFFGAAPAALRLPAFVAGVLLIPATAWLAWTAFRSRAAALLAALATCGSSQLIEYSANSRGYSWLALFTTLQVICTLYLISAPAKRRLWFFWGVLGALGACTLPIMVCPVAGLMLAIVISAFRAPRGSNARREFIRAGIVGASVCGALTLLCYLPILLTQGTARIHETGQWAYRIWGGHITSYPSMLLAAWSVWTRDSHLLWEVVLVVGFVMFAVQAVRRRTPQYITPLMMLAGALLVVWVLRAPFRPRAWMFALPTFLACAMGGVGVLAAGSMPSRLRQAVSALGVLAVAAVAIVPLVTVSQRRHLASEPNVLFDIEEIIDECAAYGTKRCALVARYTPAARYYLLQKKMAGPLPPAHPQVDRVFIVTDTVNTLGQAWHEGVEGFGAYGPPRPWRRLSHSTIYVADRVPGAESSRRPTDSAEGIMLAGRLDQGRGKQAGDQ